MDLKNQKMVPRSDEEPKFNIKNKTDKKILITILLIIGISILVLGGLIAIYFLFF